MYLVFMMGIYDAKHTRQNPGVHQKMSCITFLCGSVVQHNSDRDAHVRL